MCTSSRAHGTTESTPCPNIVQLDFSHVRERCMHECPAHGQPSLTRFFGYLYRSSCPFSLWHEYRLSKHERKDRPLDKFAKSLFVHSSLIQDTKSESCERKSNVVAKRFYVECWSTATSIQNSCTRSTKEGLSSTSSKRLANSSR